MKYSAEQKQEVATKRFRGWHYQFDLGDGVITQPSRPIQAWHECRKSFIMGFICTFLGNSLRGMRCLDIGCNAGFWSFELAKMQADYIRAVDSAQGVIDQAKFVRDCIQHDREFEMIDFEARDLFDIEESVEPFDLILALGVAYHLTDLVGFFQRVYRLSKRIVVVDSTVSTRDEAILEISDHTKYISCAEGEFSFVPTAKTLSRVLQHVGFKNVLQLMPTPDLLEPYRKGERVVLVALKS